MSDSPRRFSYIVSFLDLVLIFSSLLTQDWLPTVQLVLQADWQLDTHSPHPVLWSLTSVFFATVVICFIIKPPILIYYMIIHKKIQKIKPVNKVTYFSPGANIVILI
jgi:hypothetical protein